MDKPHKRCTQHGVTLVEALVVTGLAAIAAALAAPGMQESLDRRRLDLAANELAANLQLARTEAVARNQPVRLSWYASDGCYLVHTGAVGDCRCTADGLAQCDAPATAIRAAAWSAADRVALQSNAASITFDPLHGTATPGATLRVLGADGRAIHHVVNVMGRVRSCSPRGAVPGLRPC